MKAIEKDLRNAWIAGTAITRNNSYIKIVEHRQGMRSVELYLFDNLIARRHVENGKHVHTAITMSGWNSLTTRSRLSNVVGCRIYSKGRKPHFSHNDQEVDPWGWYILEHIGLHDLHAAT